MGIPRRLEGVKSRMYRNQYDTDCITWAPQGRIYQIEYALEAVKQGSACNGLRSKSHAVLATLKRAASDLASYQQKIFKIDDHMAIGIAGLTADGRVLSRYMRQECMNHKYVYERPMPVGHSFVKLQTNHRSGHNGQERGLMGSGFSSLAAMKMDPAFLT